MGNFVGGNYAVAMGRRAEAFEDHCVAIGLDPSSTRNTRAKQKGDFVVRSLIIQLNAGRDENEEGPNPLASLVINSENIMGLKRLVDCSVARRREEALSEEELELLDILEDYEDTVEENELEIEDLNLTIDDLLSTLEQKNQKIHRESHLNSQQRRSTYRTQQTSWE